MSGKVRSIDHVEEEMGNFGTASCLSVCLTQYKNKLCVFYQI
jgi:hypothetical protein